MVEPLPVPPQPFWMPEVLERRARYQAELAAGRAPVWHTAPGYEWTATTPWDDPAALVTQETLTQYRTRLTATPPDPWVASSTLTLRCPSRSRQSPDGQLHLLQEAPIKATAARIRRHSLEPDPTPAPLLDRLRMLHARLLPASTVGTDGRVSPWFPVAARPITLASGEDGVEDSFSELPGDDPSAWQASVAVDDHEGLVATIGGPGERRDAMRAAAVVLGGLRLEGLDDPGFSWVVPHMWGVEENLLLSIGVLDAQVKLERLREGWGHDDWVQESFNRAPFLRDRYQLGRRDVQVNGMGAGEMLRFDWQPSGRGRLLTSVAWAVRDGYGFMFTLEVSLEAAEDLLLTDPDELLASVEVR